MSLDTLYADGINESIKRWAANPGPAPEQSFSATSFLGSGATGLPSGALQAAGSALDAMSGFGTPLAASGVSAGGMFAVPTPEEAKQEAEARDRMLKGDSFDTSQGNVLRRKAEEFAPDPLTTHKADQVIHDVGRVMGKAVGAVATMGPVAGPVALGVEEGNTVTQNLRMKGVDTGTAMQVGAVTGAVTGLTVALPLGGKTWLETFGLVATGGPGSYMVQEALSRDILQRAGYADEASLHNPFDPLGLTLSTVIPGGFGAFHMRGVGKRKEAVAAGQVPLAQLKPDELRGLKYDDARLDAFAAQAAETHGVPPAILLAIKNVGEKSGPTATSPKGAVGVMQFMPGTAKEMGLADRTDPVASIDAGARYLRKLFDAYGSWDAAIAHYNGGGTQAAIVRGGGRPTYNETAGYLDRVQQYVSQHTAQAASKSPEVVDAARVKVLDATVAKSLPDTPDAMAQVMRAGDIVAESGGRVAEVEIAPVPHSFGEQLDRALAERGIVVQASDRSFATGQPGQRTIMLADLPESDFMAKHGNSVDDVKAHEFAHTFWAGATALPNFRDPMNAPLRAELATISREFRPTVWERHAEYAGKQDELLADGMAFWLKNPERRGDFPQVDKMMRGYDAGDLLRHFPDAPVARAPAPAVRAADNALPPADSVTLAEAAPVKAGGAQLASAGGDGASKSAPANGKSAAAGGAEPVTSTSPAASLDAQLAQQLAADKPDLQVVLPGEETPVSVKDALARIAEDRKADEQWAQLVRVAAECALGT